MAQGPALHARSTLLRAVLALREGRHAAAEVAAWEAQHALRRKGWDFCWGIQQRIRGIKRFFFFFWGGPQFCTRNVGVE